jgi:hypothetical protein
MLQSVQNLLDMLHVVQSLLDLSQSAWNGQSILFGALLTTPTMYTER